MAQAGDIGQLLLYIALRHRPKAADAAEGLARTAEIAGHPIDPQQFRDAIAKLLADGLIYDPVHLEPGHLQCYWQLEVTPAGAEAAA